MSKTLILSDIHANVTALNTILDAEPAHDSVIFLGDAVDGGPHPNTVCEHLLELNLVAAVYGNHDRSVLDASDASQSDDNPFKKWREWTYDQLSAESREFLESLDRTTSFSPRSSSFRLHHGDFPPPEGHYGTWPTRVTPEDNTALFETVATRYDEDVIVHGHSHFPFKATVAGTTFINPGSVGLQPDGWPLNHARYAVFEDGAIDLREVEYDTSVVTMDSQTLDSPYQGYWDHSSTSAGTE